MHPKVSIIIPVYNAEEYIHRCLASILLQTFTDFECILVDDCTPDNSGKICDEYAAKDPRIKVIHNAHNKGSSLSRKIGFENSSGEFIQFVDSDDWIEPDMTEKLYAKAVSEDLDMVICDCFYVKNDSRINIKQDFSSLDKITLIKKIINRRVKSYLYNKFLKKELLMVAKFPVYSRCEDYYLSIQNFYNSNKIGYINEYFYHYHYNPQSLSQNKERMLLGLIEENKNWCAIIDFLKEKYESIRIFDPELSRKINNLKLKYFFNKDLRNMKDLFRIYPESKFYRQFLFALVRKIIKKYRFFVIKNKHSR